MCSKLRIVKPSEYFAKAGLEGIALDSCFVLQSVVDDIDSIVKEAIIDKSWVDLSVCYCMLRLLNVPDNGVATFSERCDEPHCYLSHHPTEQQEKGS
jgi:hypothetical protein